MKYPFYLTLLPVLMLAACSEDVAGLSNEMARKALNDHYAKHCISFGEENSTQNFPVTVDPSQDVVDDRGNNQSKKWDALVTAGLLTVEGQNPEEAVAVGGAESSGQKVYSLTQKGQDALDHNLSFCIGHYRVDDIRNKTLGANWTGGEPTVSVDYRISPTKVPGWAQRYVLRRTWPQLRTLLRKKRHVDALLIQNGSDWTTSEDYTSAH